MFELRRIYAISVFAIISACCFSLSAFCEESQKHDSFKNIMEASFATIDKVSFSAPSAGMPCQVMAKISIYDDREKANIISVRLVYAVNGGDEIGIEMTDNFDGTWTTAIPGQESGNRVIFYIRITDSNSNVTTGAISSASNLVKGEPDIDDPVDAVPDNSDLINISANYDKDYFYIGFDVQGVVDGGSIDTQNILLYGIQILNPDIDDSYGLSHGSLLMYMPKAIGTKYMKKARICPLQNDRRDGECLCSEKELHDYTSKTGLFFIDIAGDNTYDCLSQCPPDCLLAQARPTAEIKDGVFTVRVRREAFGNNPSGHFRFIALSAVNKGLDYFMPLPLKCTNYLTLYTSNFSYVVK